MDELLLQSTLMVGWPRALSAAAIWRRIAGPARSLEDGAEYGATLEWGSRGEAVCRVIYGTNYDRLLDEALDIVRPMLGSGERAVLASLWDRMRTS